MRRFKVYPVRCYWMVRDTRRGVDLGVIQDEASARECADAMESATLSWFASTFGGHVHVYVRIGDIASARMATEGKIELESVISELTDEINAGFVARHRMLLNRYQQQ